MIWLIPDTHWNHPNIIVYEKRPDNYKDLIIENWRAMIAPSDTVIHLGDVIFHDKHELKPILESLPGIKILVMGNHDKRTGTNSWFLRMGFNYVCKSHEYKNVLFSHKPLDMSQYPNLDFNVHGHFHRNSHTPEQYPFYDIKKHIKVSIEENDYKPVQLGEVIGKQVADELCS